MIVYNFALRNIFYISVTVGSSMLSIPRTLKCVCNGPWSAADRFSLLPSTNRCIRASLSFYLHSWLDWKYITVYLQEKWIKKCCQNNPNMKIMMPLSHPAIYSTITLERTMSGRLKYGIRLHPMLGHCYISANIHITNR